jgi:RNA polymerase sigma-70 factor (ECF subfamily)
MPDCSPLRAPGFRRLHSGVPTDGPHRAETRASPPLARAVDVPLPGAHAPADDDQRLLADIRAGRAGAWQQLLMKYQDRLFVVCYRMVGPGPRGREIAADLTQDAMVKVVQGLTTFDGKSKLSTWMIRVTMNVVLSWQRAQKHRRHASLDVPASGEGAGRSGGSGQAGEGAGAGPTWAKLLAGREPATPSSVSHEEERERLARALAEIDPDQRALLVLRDVRDLDYDQIASVLDVPVGTVKSRLFRARASLREAYESLSPRTNQRPST